MSADGNKALVNAFYEQAFSDYQPEQAAEAHLGESCGQFPDLRLDIKRAVAEGDVVTRRNLHLKPGDRGMAVADFWRVVDGKIVEHWDVIQEVPEKSANDNTMF
ncbi:nuclear transport factor 2 family protein [Streptomyces canus]|uniref:nuclear transport factor 2 family protein n=1 Tax=Streptomyces canus TaxID=58343 RepID=UPI0007495026|nr:ester cyclase [Streptomyces canus]KUN08244.1 hypothetical protein AQI96_26835 [Streptomyces canus]